MAWRESLLRLVGPGLLGGLTFGKWVQLLRANRFAVAPERLPRALAITCQSIQNSLFQWNDRRQLGGELDDVDVPPPLFLLGHWRHGTTHLHNLLTVDKRFAYPNNYQALFPSTFLTAERLHSRVVDFFMPKRRPMDNVEWDMSSPQEDEFALCIESFMSPCMGWAFPQRREHYDQYLTFRGAPDHEVAAWQTTLLRYLKKLTWKLKRPLILKSPPHTGRIKLLLQLFPEAKFVHIHRNPFDVFPSCQRTFRVNFDLHGLQRRRVNDLDGWILRQYRAMYDAFFEERALIPTGHFHEVRFEDLERDARGQVKRLYNALDLPDFLRVEPALQNYIGSVVGYQKNQHPELPDELREQISRQWRRPIEEWGYQE
jgi:omega-hydroxy-beta-dihydromenaquinone-9 sulfotransferase